MVITLDGNRVESPDRWEDPKLTTAKYQEIVKWDYDKELADRDYFKLFKINTGLEYSSFRDTPENKAEIWNAVRWVVETAFPETVTPLVFDFQGKLINVPRELRMLSIGQNIKARQTLDKSVVLVDKESGALIDFSCYSMIVAIYLQPLVYPTQNPKIGTGGFDWVEAQKLELVIREMPIYLIKPIGFFLLKNVLGYGQKPARNWLQILTNLKEKFRRMLPTLRKYKDLSRIVT